MVSPGESCRRWPTCRRPRPIPRTATWATPAPSSWATSCSTIPGSRDRRCRWMRCAGRWARVARPAASLSTWPARAATIRPARAWTAVGARQRLGGRRLGRHQRLGLVQQRPLHPGVLERAGRLAVGAGGAGQRGGNMNGNRLRTAWVLASFYRQEHQAVFTDHPLPITGNRAQVAGADRDQGAARRTVRAQPRLPDRVPGCREPKETGAASGCFPRFPLEGKPGSQGRLPAGQHRPSPGATPSTAWPARTRRVTWMMVNFGQGGGGLRVHQSSAATPPSIATSRTCARATPRDDSGDLRAAERGARLFVGKAACNECHNTPCSRTASSTTSAVAQVGPGVPTEADCPAGGGVRLLTVVGRPRGNNCLPWGAGRRAVQAASRNRWRGLGVQRRQQGHVPQGWWRWRWRRYPRAPGARPRCATWP